MPSLPQATDAPQPSGLPAKIEAQRRLDALAKPMGSLGRLERLAVRLAETQNRLDPRTGPRRLVLFAGDHGVVAEGIGPWPSDVTAAMVRTILDGQACSSALARTFGAEIVVVDAGSKTAEPLRHAGYRDWRAGRGTRNLAREPAMTADEFRQAWRTGERAAEEAVHAGTAVMALGEMGIGNTTPAACLAALLTGSPAAAVVGPGAGTVPGGLERKIALVEQAVARVRLADDPVAAMAAVAGFEIVALAGCIAAGARWGVTVVLDGFIVAAAALVARTLEPNALCTAIAAHRGSEPGHAGVLEHLGLQPFLEWDLRLGEGTGALLLLPLLDAAAALLTEVATLAAVVGR
ncbi:MAG: nicotinate-nucleotide--dimethylbenzimidazole phosphoribosyltransferase [Hyphomicrobiaceae bacterium]